MGGSNDPRRLLRVLNLRQGYVERYGKHETAPPVWKEAHTAVDRDVAHIDALATTHYAESTLEAGGITPAAAAAQLGPVAGDPPLFKEV